MASPNPLLLFLVAALVCATIPTSSSGSAPAHADGGGGGGKVCNEAQLVGIGPDMGHFEYCNASLPYADRVRDLIGRMAVEENVGSLGDWASSPPHVGLPPYEWWSEALHGLSSRGPAAKPRLHSGRAAVYNGTVFRQHHQQRRGLQRDALEIHRQGLPAMCVWWEKTFPSTTKA